MPSAKPIEGEDTFSEVRPAIRDNNILPRRVFWFNSFFRIYQTINAAEELDDARANVLPIQRSWLPRARHKCGRIAPGVDDLFCPSATRLRDGFA